LTRRMAKGLADHTGLRLAVETSILVLLAGAWLWGIVTLGAHATAAQGASSDGEGSSGARRYGAPPRVDPRRGGRGRR